MERESVEKSMKGKNKIEQRIRKVWKSLQGEKSGNKVWRVYNWEKYAGGRREKTIWRVEVGEMSKLAGKGETAQDRKNNEKKYAG